MVPGTPEWANAPVDEEEIAAAYNKIADSAHRNTNKIIRDKENHEALCDHLNRTGGFQVVAQALVERILLDERKTMERKATQQDVEELIRTTYSDASPDPNADMSEVEKRLSFYGWGSGFSQEVFLAYNLPSPNYEWDADRIELLGEELEEERYEELLDGAALTAEEEAIFRAGAEKEAADCAEGLWITRIYRVGLTKESSEQRAVFFVWSGFEIGQISETQSCGGPFRDILEAVHFDNPDKGKWDEEEITCDFPERARLEEWQNSRMSNR